MVLIKNQTEVQKSLRELFSSEDLKVSAETNFAYEISGSASTLEKMFNIILASTNWEIGNVTSDRTFTEKDCSAANATFLKLSNVYKKVLMTPKAVEDVQKFISEKVKEYVSEKYWPYLQITAENRKVDVKKFVLDLATTVELQKQAESDCVEFNLKQKSSTTSSTKKIEPFEEDLTKQVKTLTLEDKDSTTQPTGQGDLKKSDNTVQDKMNEDETNSYPYGHPTSCYQQ